MKAAIKMITDGCIILVVASAGGLKAISELLTNLPKDFPTLVLSSTDKVCHVLL